MIKNENIRFERHPQLNAADFDPVEVSLLEAIPEEIIGSSIINHLQQGVYDNGLAPFIKADALMHAGDPSRMAVNRFLAVPPDFLSLSDYESARRQAIDAMYETISVLKAEKKDAEANSLLSPMGEYALEFEKYKNDASRQLHHAEVILNYLVTAPSLQSLALWRNIRSKEQRNMHLRQRLPHENEGRIDIMIHYLMDDLKRNMLIPSHLREKFHNVAKSLSRVKLMLHHFDVMLDKGLVGAVSKEVAADRQSPSNIDVAFDNIEALSAEVSAPKLFDFSTEQDLIKNLILTHSMASEGHVIDEVVPVREVLERAGRFLAFAERRQGATLLDDRDQFRLEFRTINYLEALALEHHELDPVTKALEKMANLSEINALATVDALVGNYQRLSTVAEALSAIKVATKNNQKLYNILYQVGGEDAVTPYMDLLDQVRAVRKGYDQGARLDRATSRLAVRLMDSIASHFGNQGEEFNLYRRAGTALNKLHTTGSFENLRNQRRVLARQSVKPAVLRTGIKL